MSDVFGGSDYPLAETVPGSSQSRVREAIAVALILLAAAAARLVALGWLPSGLHQDEAVYLVDSEIIYFGSPHIYFGEREPLFMYVVAFFSHILGPSPTTLRIASALIGLVGVAAGGAFARQLFGRNVGLLTAFGLATSLWLTALNRTGFRANSLPTVECLGLALLWRATRTGRRRDYAISGVVLGLTLYTYLSARFIPIALFLFILIAAIFFRAWLAKCFRGLVIAGVAAFVTCIPLGIYGLRNPEMFFGRPDQVALPGGAAFLPALVDSSLRTLGMLWVYGDPTWRHNLSGAPVFDPLNGVLFGIGLIVALWRRSPATIFVVTILGVMLTPGMLSIDSPHYLRTGGAVGPIYIVWAIGLASVSVYLFHANPTARWIGTRRTLALVAIVIPLAVAGVRDGWGYFVTYANDPDMPASYNVEHAAAGRILAASPIWKSDRTNVYVSDRYQQDRSSISAFLFPLLTPAERDRWLDPDIVGTFIPQNELVPLPVGPSLYVLSGDGQAVHATLGPAIQSETKVDLGYGRSIDVIQANPSGESVLRSPLTGGPATFGKFLTLEGASLDSTDSPAAVGRTVALRWKITGQPAYQPSIFVHVVDPKRRTIAQADLEIHLPTASWRVGQEWITTHQLRLPSGTLPDQYEITVGVYDKATGAIEPTFQQGKPRSTLTVLSLDLSTAIGGAGTVGDRMEQYVANGLTFLGVEPLPTRVEAGTALPVTVLWRGLGNDRPDFDAIVRLQTTSGTTVGQWQGAVGSSTYRTSQWGTGADIRQTIDVTVQPAASGGVMVTVQVVPTDRAVAADPGLPSVSLGRLVVDAATHNYVAPRPTLPTDVGFGLLGHLIGSSGISQSVHAGDSIDLHLYWRSTGPADVAYTGFVHVLDAGDRIVGQRDEAPVHGTRPTTGWVAGEFIDDTHQITIDPATPPGSYRIEVGLYDSVTGERLRTDTGDDHAIIGSLRVVAP